MVLVHVRVRVLVPFPMRADRLDGRRLRGSEALPPIAHLLFIRRLIHGIERVRFLALNPGEVHVVVELVLDAIIH